MKPYLLLVVLLCLPFCAGAQSYVPFNKEMKGLSGGSASGYSSSKDRFSNPVTEMRTLPMEFDKYSDDRMEEMNRKMEERSWGSEDTAWERARSIDSKDSYQRYIAMYPEGSHRAEATTRMIDAEVRDILNGKHDAFPGLEHVYVDDDAITSTMLIHNNTGYPLTVLCSGTDSKRVLIAPDASDTVTLTNGYYNVAASVPPAHIRPYAGSVTFTGGGYEVSFYVVNSW